ncbi:MAG: NAD(P)H-dependent oxidoreductase [Promethearchaeota archaeon]
MKIVVVNGSPKGNKLSFTMQYIYYAQKMFPHVEFNLINIGQKLNNMKIKTESFQEILKEMASADGILWSFPVYVFLVPAQLKKFIELLFENNAGEMLEGKVSGVLSTSMNFFDNTAFDYMHAIIEDLNMKYTGFFSNNTFDFNKIERRKTFYTFVKNILTAIENQLPAPKRFNPLINRKNFAFTPSEVLDEHKLDRNGQKILIITDNINDNSNLGKMISKFTNSFKNEIEVYNIENIDMKGGCISCLTCGYDNQCFYNDGYPDFIRNKLRNNDIIVYALTLKDRYFSSRYKLFVDRAFFNGHTPITEGVQMCYLLSGSLSQIENLRQIIMALSEIGGGNLVDIITDEFGESEEINDFIYNMAKKALEFSNLGYIQTPTFNSVGGYKIFRDMIYGLPGVLFQADYRFYKKRKMFDFPKNKLIYRILRLIFKSKKARSYFKKKMFKIIFRPYNKFFKKLDVEQEIREFGF